MICITALIVFFLYIVSLAYQKSYSNPLSFFLGIWSLICFLSSLKLFGMYDYSDYGPAIILIGILFFFIGYYVGMRYQIHGVKRIHFISININAEYTIREKVYVIMMAMAIAIYLVILAAVLVLFRQGYSASTIREFYRYSGETSSSGLASELIYKGSSTLRHLHQYYANSVVFASIPVMVIDIVEKGRITKISLLALIALGLSCIVTFARFNLLYAFACLIITFFDRKGKISKKLRRRITYVTIIVITALIIMFLVMNKLRNSSEPMRFVQSFYSYFSIEVPLLDYWIGYVNKHSYYSLGFSFISGIVANLMNVLAKFNIVFPAYEVCKLVNYGLVDHFIQVFPNNASNAYVSMFFAFYLDFREIGVVIGSLIYGFIIARSYKKSKVNRASNAFYLLLFYGVFTSFIRWQFILVGYCFSFIFLRLLFKKNKDQTKTDELYRSAKSRASTAAAR